MDERQGYKAGAGPCSPRAVLLSSAVAPGAGLMSLIPCNPPKDNCQSTFCAFQVVMPTTYLVTNKNKHAKL